MSFRTAVTAAVATVASGLTIALPTTASTAAAPAAPAASTPGVVSEAQAGGLAIENSFVSAQGWVKPGDTYPSRIILTNTTEQAASGATVTISAPRGSSLTDARGPGSHPVTADQIVWAPGTIAAGATATLVLESVADTTRQEPTIVWRDLSSTAVLDTSAGDATVTSHGPKVIPPGEAYETAKYGDRPFPVVPVAYTDKDYRDHAKDLDTVINDPAFEGSTFNLFQEMSLGQLYPHGTVPSTGKGTVAFGAGEAGYDFTPRAVPGDTCTGGATFADSPASPIGTPVYPNRIEGDVYQLPGNLAFYGADAGGTAIAGPGSIDSGCGSPGKLVRDAAVIADPDIDYSDYDTDKDGVVDFFMAVFAGCGGNGASQAPAAFCEFADEAPADNVWPHSSSLEFYYSDEETGLPGYTTDDQLKDLEGRPLWYTDDNYAEMTTTDTGDALKVFVRVGPYNVNPETAIDKASVISHEYGHSLGLPDFYSTDSRETYGDWNLMATDKSQNMDIFSRQELGWVVPEVLTPGSQRTVSDWTDSKEDTDTITWQRPDGTPYTLTEGADGRVQNSEAYVAKLPGRQLLDPAVFETGDKATPTHTWWSGSGNDFNCAPQGGHNLDFVIPELATVDPESTVTLELKSLWDIEWDYDYGFVLTTTDQGETYTSHESENGYTTSNTDPLAGNPYQNACQAKFDNGITGSSGSYDAGTEAADRKTDTYPDSVFVADSFDISDLAGEQAGALRFSYATDPGLAKNGWFIDDLKVTVTEPGEQPREVFVTDLETSGGPADERVYNGGCREDLSTAQQCTVGWNYVAAGAETPADHAYYLELRDRSGFDLDGNDQIDRSPIAFQAGLSMVYTDEAHGYGNAGVPNPPAQSPLDSQPDPGNEAPDLNDAAWTAADGDSTFSDSGQGHTDNYTDPGNEEEGNPWVFRYDCLTFDVLAMTGNADGPAVADGDLTGDVAFTMGDGCGTFDYGYVASDAPTAALAIDPSRPFTTTRVELSGAGSRDDETPRADLDYSWNFHDGGSADDASGRVVRTRFDDPGYHRVTLTVTDEDGGTDTATQRVLVREFVDCEAARVDLAGGWRTVRDRDAHGGEYCDNQGRGSGRDTVELDFSGQRLVISHGQARDGGRATVFIDGEERGVLSFRHDAQGLTFGHHRLYRDLGAGEHTVRIVMTRGTAYLDGFILRG